MIIICLIIINPGSQRHTTRRVLSCSWTQSLPWTMSGSSRRGRSSSLSSPSSMSPSLSTSSSSLSLWSLLLSSSSSSCHRHHHHHVFQAIQWMRNPTPQSELKSFEPFNCNYSHRPPRCSSPKVIMMMMMMTECK